MSGPSQDQLMGLIKLFTALYGRKFIREYGEDNFAGYRFALSGFTENDIKRGLETLRRESKFAAYAPGPLVFRDWCIGIKKRDREEKLPLHFQCEPPVVNQRKFEENVKQLLGQKKGTALLEKVHSSGVRDQEGQL